MKTRPSPTRSRRVPKIKTRLEFSEFDIVAELGVGTVGTIYEALRKKTGETVAVKVLLPTVSINSLVAHRFEREMLILEKLDHPNIVRYFGGGVEGQQLFYAMEFVRGGALKDLMERVGRLSWQEVCACGQQICSALQFAHNHGIIHRDLKPANLFLTESGQLKLGDFGVARDTHEADITDAGLTVGTYAYMSPEQIRGDRQITGKADLYALGCLLFELLTGRQPYLGGNFAQLFDQHLHAEIPRVRSLIADCPEELDEIAYQLMQKDPDARPFNARFAQAVLMRLSGRDELPASSEDVSAEFATAGQQQLSQRLQTLRELDSSRDVSWWKIAALVGAVIAAVAFGALVF